MRRDDGGCETLAVGGLIFMVSVPCWKLLHMIIFAHAVSDEVGHLPRDLDGILVRSMPIWRYLLSGISLLCV